MENNDNWFENVKLRLIDELKDKDYVDGGRFINQYFEINWPNELDDNADDEQFEAFVNEKLDLFEAWLKNSSDIKINDNYIWEKITPQIITNSPSVADELVLDNEQLDLLSKEFRELTKVDFPELCNLRDILYKIDNIAEAKITALKAAKIGEANTEIEASLRAQAWDALGLIKVELGESDAYTDFEKAGSIALNNGDLLSAAQYFEKASENCPDDDWKTKNRLLRKARVLYSSEGVNSSASKLYVKECDLELKHSKGWEKFAGHFYRLLSNYGESPWKVLGWISGLILLCASIYWYADINTPGAGIYKCNNLTLESSYICAEQNSGQTNVMTHIYFSVVTFTTLGYGDYSPTVGTARAVASIQAFLGLMLSSLFIATFLRKFSR